LAGGLGAWEKAGLKVDSGEPPSTRPKGRYKSSFKKELIVDMRTVNQSSEGRGQIVDARSPERFNGTAPEPRAGLKGGNIPGSVNIPFRELLVPLEGGPEMTLAPPEQIEQIFSKKGIKTDERVITTCGSGVSAAVLALGLQHAGKNKWTLYDGSWAEWGRINIPNRII
jgi:thiosulfate/3-mercaptopyruvate sulfurtransferase